ncbi:MAG: DUF72 domain-containing protein [Candidatus Eisenbacteria bacterium]|nr:DUF72 domain-containing protein [Candidatus Eisenbacteria bacterium]MCC7144284.1 DUF72 domain-containing protein [Candidatus Eisenbacteria bacterium]
MIRFDLEDVPPGLRLGTSSFSSADWHGGFYPEGLPPAEFLLHYSSQLPTVEIDATWHMMPSVRMVKAWAEKTPESFVFALKVPKVITHELYLEDCTDEWNQFVRALEPLGTKLGPVLLQFQYVAKGKDPEEYRTGARFRERLARFLDLVPSGMRVAVEVRNEKWLGDPLYDLLRTHNVALALTAFYTMPSGPSLLAKANVVTADFSYLRFLGNHKSMDEAVANAREEGKRRGDWDSIIVDRTEEMRPWLPAIRDLLASKQDVFTYFNNHYAGFAPGSIDLFLRLWRGQV